MPCTVPKISVRAGTGKNADVQTANARAIPRQTKNFLSFIFTLTRAENQPTTH
jgi:hypothetical protein